MEDNVRVFPTTLELQQRVEKLDDRERETFEMIGKILELLKGMTEHESGNQQLIERT